MNIVIDSSILVSSFGLDKFTPQANIFIEKLIKNTDYIIIIPTLVIAETITVVSRIVPKPDLLEIQRYLNLFQTVGLDTNFIDEMTDFFSSNSSLLKTSDLVIALTAKLHSATLITWDAQLLSQNICRVTSPENFLCQK